MSSLNEKLKESIDLSKSTKASKFTAFSKNIQFLTASFTVAVLETDKLLFFLWVSCGSLVVFSGFLVDDLCFPCAKH